MNDWPREGTLLAGGFVRPGDVTHAIILSPRTIIIDGMLSVARMTTIDFILIALLSGRTTRALRAVASDSANATAVASLPEVFRLTYPPAFVTSNSWESSHVLQLAHQSWLHVHAVCKAWPTPRVRDERPIWRFSSADMEMDVRSVRPLSLRWTDRTPSALTFTRRHNFHFENGKHQKHSHISHIGPRLCPLISMLLHGMVQFVLVILKVMAWTSTLVTKGWCRCRC